MKTLSTGKEARIDARDNDSFAKVDFSSKNWRRKPELAFFVIFVAEISPFRSKPN